MSMIGTDRRVIFAILGMALAGGLGLSAAKANDERPRVPPEAVDACRDKGRGDACTVSFRGHDIQGTCRTVEGDEIVCVPNQAPPPPPEALDACRDKGRGDACTVAFRGRELQGSCFEGEAGLFCRPSKPPSGK